MEICKTTLNRQAAAKSARVIAAEPYRDLVARAQALHTDTRFKDLLGARAWSILPKEVQNRFSMKARAGASIIYRGVTAHLRMNHLGRLLAQALRVIGAPLPLEPSEGPCPAFVTVTDDLQAGGQIWTRVYARKSGFPQMVNSAKRFAGPTGLEEHVGGGIGMTLRLSVRDKALLFLSDAYFVEIFNKRFVLPRWLTPGDLEIGHHDRGGGAFAFTMTLNHPVFGLLIDQYTIFQDMEEARHDH